MKYGLIFLILGGCAYTTTVELLRVANECGTGDEGNPLWAAYNERLENLEKKQKRNKTCPPGYAYFEDGAKKGCVERGDLGRWMRRQY